ncbi:hypothetical protein ACP70R_011683 [Stipagrostis hirtigluma subsp. patula]
MSTCSTATSARRGHESPRRPGCDVDGGDGHLEARLRDLERDWDAYKKIGRSGAPRRHRRSRSATATPSSAVTAAAPGPDDGLCCPLLRLSPRSLLASLQQASSGTDVSDGGAVAVAAKRGSGGQGQGQARRGDEDASSVCSVKTGYSISMVTASASCSCPCRCAVPCCGYYSTSSSSAAAAASSLSPGEGGVVGEHGTRRVERARVMGTAGWFAVIALAVVGAVAMAILEFGMDDGSAEFLVPT